MDLIRDLAIVMLIAGVVTVLFHYLRQPVVLGYIAAGVVIGPYTPPFELIRNHDVIVTLADLGVVFLLFSLGLEFRLRKLRAVGATAFIAATLEISLMIAIGFEIGEWLGWSDIDSLFLGAMMSISSTTIIVKALNELGLAGQRFSELVFGILIVEDILAIAMLALLSSIAMTGSLDVAAVTSTLAHLGIFLSSILVVGLLVVPPLLAFVARAGSDEMLLVSVLGLCFGVCLVAFETGYSIALGAFLIGAIMAESAQRHQIERLVAPLRDLFSAVFFVAIGLLIDPAVIARFWLPIAVISVAVIAGKVLTCLLGTFVAGNSPRDSVRVGMSLAQIGEFSFIIATLGTQLRVTSEFLYPIAVAVSAVTTFSTPYLIRAADPTSSWLSRRAPKAVGGALSAYAGWASTGHRRGARMKELRLVRRLALQIALNLSLIIAVFAVTTAITVEATRSFPGLPWWMDTPQEIAQLLSLAIALPLVLMTLAKLRRLSIPLARASLRRGADPHHHKTVARLLFGSASFAVGLAVLSVSLPALPDLESLALWLVILTAAGIALWRPSIRAQRAADRRLRRTLARE